MRYFNYASYLENNRLSLALAPALTPIGIDNNPLFFNGDVIYPQITARCLLVLAEVTSTRYYNFVPSTLRDPIITAQGNMIRMECFSACNGVYARLDLMQSSLNGEIGYGTTNVDISATLRTALTYVNQNDKLLLKIGHKGLKSIHISESLDNSAQIESIVEELPVKMPNRWVKALGNCAMIHAGMAPVLTLNTLQSQMFVNKLPSATGQMQALWVSSGINGMTLSNKKNKNSVFIPGLHRLSALKRILTHVKTITFYQGDEPGHMLVEVQLEQARLSLSLTAQPYEGYSGEGSLLISLADNQLIQAVESVQKQLAFDATIDTINITHKLGMLPNRLSQALAFLAASGKVGFDLNQNSYYHRELPTDESRVLKDNPRLKAAHMLVNNIQKQAKNRWIVNAEDNQYLVCWDGETPLAEARCTCHWSMTMQNKRGPCKHILAVHLKEQNNDAF